MDVKKKDVREKQLYRSTYQQIVPDEEVVERLLLMESTLENGGKRYGQENDNTVQAVYVCAVVYRDGAADAGCSGRCRANSVI